MEDRRKFLEQVHDQIKVCQKCPLARGRSHAVPGEGNAEARVMFVGEGPGQAEDAQGRPFVGPAGKFLNELLLLAGLRRPEVFITNIVKCRPPNNRAPFAEEVIACQDFLVAQIALILPKVICPLGSPALKALIDPNLSISRVHCTLFRKSGIAYVPLYHPAAALHNENLKGVLRQDMVKLKAVLAKELAIAEGEN